MTNSGTKVKKVGCIENDMVTLKNFTNGDRTFNFANLSVDNDIRRRLSLFDLMQEAVPSNWYLISVDGHLVNAHAQRRHVSNVRHHCGV
jgi:hypothetical protein